ncbi:MAG: thiol:disulfide interchange protein DsbA/DsbL [Brachymonas sp.]
MMNRRQITQAAALGLSAGSGLALAQAATAAKAPPPAAAPASTVATLPISPGKDFLAINPKASVEAPAGKIEVVEFFWFNCSHCYHFEALLNPWVAKLPAHVAYRKVPVGFDPNFVPQQKMFYALEAMGLLSSLMPKIFKAIHEQRIKLDTEAQITEWLAKQGVDKAKFSAMFSSFAIASKATRATKLQNAYQLDGVPALGVAGQYLTNGTMTGGMPRMLQVASALIARASAKGNLKG